MPPEQNDHPGTSSLHHNRITRLVSKDNREVGSCAVSEIGLENFITTLVKEVNINLADDIEFNLNERGILYAWKDVFTVEATYSKCLGISKRLYSCNSFVHEPDQGLAYFIMEEFNQRSYPFLPEFSCHILIFCWYNTETRSVTKVSVQYDQYSFFLHCLGIERLWRWVIGNILTPPARLWAKAYFATGLVNPFTFVAQIALFVWGISKLCSSY
jgi:hypothetical protein